MKRFDPRGPNVLDVLPAVLIALAGALPIAAWSLAPQPGQAVMIVLAPGDRAEQAAFRLAAMAGWRLLRLAGPWPLPALVVMPDPGTDPDALRRAARGLFLVNATGQAGCAPPPGQGL